MRCAYCHDALRRGQAVTCRTCGTRVHSACRLELESCPTLGCTAESVVLPRRTPNPAFGLALFTVGLLACTSGYAASDRQLDDDWLAAPGIAETCRRIVASTDAARLHAAAVTHPHVDPEDRLTCQTGHDHARLAFELAFMLEESHPHAKAASAHTRRFVDRLHCRSCALVRPLVGRAFAQLDHYRYWHSCEYGKLYPGMKHGCPPPPPVHVPR